MYKVNLFKSCCLEYRIIQEHTVCVCYFFLTQSQLFPRFLAQLPFPRMICPLTMGEGGESTRDFDYPGG